MAPVNDYSSNLEDMWLRRSTNTGNELYLTTSGRPCPDGMKMLLAWGPTFHHQKMVRMVPAWDWHEWLIVSHRTPYLTVIHAPSLIHSLANSHIWNLHWRGLKSSLITGHHTISVLKSFITVTSAVKSQFTVFILRQIGYESFHGKIGYWKYWLHQWKLIFKIEYFQTAEFGDNFDSKMQSDTSTRNKKWTNSTTRLWWFPLYCVRSFRHWWTDQTVV